MSILAKRPALDDRTYADILAEARQRIPRYTPEWNDFNPGDTGMALVELFAWMTELLVYRTNRMPDLAQLKFLELLGIDVASTKPAVAYVTVAAEAGWPSATIDLPKRSQFSAEGPDGTMIFETERRLVVFAPVLDRIAVLVDGVLTDQSASEATLQGFWPFGEGAERDSALTLGFAYDGAFPARTELCLTVFSATDSGAVTCGRPQTVDSRIVWESFDGRDWRSLSLLSDETSGFRVTGQIFLKTSDAARMRSAKMTPGDDRERYWIRARLEGFDGQAAPKILTIRSNTVLVTQGETIEGEILGSSDATANQTFLLANTPVLAGSLDLAIDEGEGYQSWVEIDEFVEPEATFGFSKLDPVARAAQRFYLLDRSAGQVVLGDGRLSHAPVVNVERPRSNVLARSYRRGGGAAGNVRPGAIATLLSPVPGIDAGKVGNALAAAGGADEETVESAKERASRSLKARDRAVTAEDFELIAQEAGAIGRTRALPLFHPDFPTLPVPGVVSVVVVPEPSQRAVRDAVGEADMEARGRLVPTQGLLREVCAHLDRARLVTTEVHVVPPVYREVRITAEIYGDGTIDDAALKLDLVAALDTLFHPLRGGTDGRGWPFGGTIFFSWVHRALLLPGVGRLGTVTIALDGEDHPVCSDVLVEGPSTLLYSGEHEVSLLFAEEEAA